LWIVHWAIAQRDGPATHAVVHACSRLLQGRARATDVDATMTDDQARRFAEWQDGLTVDILEQSTPAIADDLADWYCHNHHPGLDLAAFPEELRAALLRRVSACCGERIRAGHGFYTRAGDLEACGPTCCDRINETHGV